MSLIPNRIPFDPDFAAFCDAVMRGDEQTATAWERRWLGMALVHAGEGRDCEGRYRDRHAVLRGATAELLRAESGQARAR